jgi:hypothetical protein
VFLWLIFVESGGQAFHISGKQVDLQWVECTRRRDGAATVAMRDPLGCPEKLGDFDQTECPLLVLSDRAAPVQRFLH